ncbi:MAG: hypothetical protein QXU88_00395 [Candidatus Woesearchaeota archaeon]
MISSELVQKAFSEIFPDKPFYYVPLIRYSGRLKGYNANVRFDEANRKLIFSLSKAWKAVEPAIKLGLLQALLVKLFKRPVRTLHIELYHNFLSSLGEVADVKSSHPELEASFERVNNRYFGGMLTKPNLIFSKSLARLGSYDYATDTITISRALLSNKKLLDYVMYHEMLHKKLKFATGKESLRLLHHTKAFKEAEARFDDAAELEKELSRLVSSLRKHKRC